MSNIIANPIKTKWEKNRSLVGEGKRKRLPGVFRRLWYRTSLYSLHSPSPANSYAPAKRPRAHAPMAIAAAAFCLLPQIGRSDTEIRFTVGAISAHFDGRGSVVRGLNSVHPGLGFDFAGSGGSDGWYVQVGAFRNSVNRPMVFGAAGISAVTFKDSELRLGLAGVDYKRLDDGRERVLLPHVQVRWGGTYWMLVPPRGEIQPYTTLILSYGWSLGY